MKKRFALIIRDSENIDNNPKLLTDEERVAQARMCCDICKSCLTCRPVDVKNEKLIEYCTMHLGDFIDYTLRLAEEAKKRNLDLRKVATIYNLKNLQLRITDDQSKIAPFFTENKIDWDEFKNL